MQWFKRRTVKLELLEVNSNRFKKTSDFQLNNIVDWAANSTTIGTNLILTLSKAKPTGKEFKNYYQKIQLLVNKLELLKKTFDFLQAKSEN